MSIEEPLSLIDVDDFTHFTDMVVFPPQEDDGIGSIVDPVIISISASPLTDTGITVSGEGTNTFTISGQYQDVFPRLFTIKQTESASLEQRSYANLPAAFTAITEMQPHSAPSLRIVTYTVTLNTGVVTIQQAVSTDWSKGRSQLLEALTRTIW